MPHNDKIRLRNAPLPTPHREVVRTVLEAVYEDAVGKALRLLRKDRLIDEFRAFSLHLQHRNIDRPVAGPKELFQSMKTRLVWITVSMDYISDGTFKGILLFTTTKL